LASRSAVGDLGRRHAVGAQAHRVEVDAHLARRQAADLDAGHALDALQPLAHDLLAQEDSSRALRVGNWTSAPG
jgi:hypothetical protein